MMKKRVVNIKDADRHDFDWGSITWLHSGPFSGSEELTVGEVVIKSGHCNPVHIHPNCEEVLYLLDGELEHSCGDETPYHLSPGESICVQRNVLHNATCVSENDARMMVSFSSAFREMKGE
jgi:quercetin dioxygenase-like cupin family protein